MKELKLEDYSIIKPFLDLADYEGYNSNFVTMMMWNHEYHIQYEVHEHFLIMLHHYKDIKFWAMPFTSPEYYQEAIDYMINYSHQHQFTFMIDCAIEDFVEKIKPIYSQQLLFERTPYNDDYIYDRQMLQTLSGKKMQKRRNHYNSFLKNYPHYVYRDLDITDDFETILSCLNRWENEKDNLSESMTSEVRGIMSLLSSKHLLDFEVGGIFIEGQMEAFIIASRLKHSTIQIHVEKANKEIRGLYPAILKEMLEHHFPDEKYVNREEDMGLENLRKSKQSLHPVKMIYKYRIYEKNLQVTQATPDDFNDIIELWKICFQDETDESTAFYFENLYQMENTYVLKNNNEILSVLQIVPMMIQKYQQIQNSYFILGVCTHPHVQGQGCMKFLMDFVLDLYKQQDIYLQAYIPKIYRPFGFHASHYHQIIDVDKTELTFNTPEPIDDLSLLKDYYEAYTASFNDYRIRQENDWYMLVKRCQAFHENIVIFKDLGYMIYHQDDNEIYITEFIYLNDEAILRMLSYWRDSQLKITLECDLRVNIKGTSQSIITMMSNQENSDFIDKNRYINEIY
ncbi:GNAT family N-acetyltransferase [Candidatus Stoquefichus sp. SB1]|uniref:GNAT family N-acetyltransferase n=1 Tax=Candidatus Stoquefichus sp. SB1 TaxID=1658109 RepID=UPI00067E95D2|nr:GNAT family N-acetyltransferase [Candidatus Stoquefichus sp. SB1]